MIAMLLILGLVVLAQGDVEHNDEPEGDWDAAFTERCDDIAEMV